MSAYFSSRTGDAQVSGEQFDTAVSEHLQPRHPSQENLPFHKVPGFQELLFSLFDISLNLKFKIIPSRAMSSRQRFRFRHTLEKLWFQFRFQLLKSYGSGSGSYF
jgi:hypothetical protein